MEAKLKALKVVELKDILTKAQVSIQGKANKPDLIAKVLASPVALEEYERQYGSPKKGVSKPAEVVFAEESNMSEQSATTQTVSQNEAHVPQPTVTAPVSAATAESTPSIAADTPTVNTEGDTELEKRKARAARFGIPLVEPSKPKAPKATPARLAPKGPKAAANISTEEQTQLDARAKRFDIADSTKILPKGPASTGKRGSKRQAPIIEAVDAEELERRKKRAERFGTSTNA